MLPNSLAFSMLALAVLAGLALWVLEGWRLPPTRSLAWGRARPKLLGLYFLLWGLGILLSLLSRES